MRERRFQRMTEVVREEIGTILRNRVADPRLGFVTINRVRLSRDATHAFVFFSTMGSDEQRRQSVEAVESCSPFVRRLLAARLGVRTVPELHFIHDTSVEDGEEVLRIMRDLSGGGG